MRRNLPAFLNIYLRVPDSDFANPKLISATLNNFIRFQQFDQKFVHLYKGTSFKDSPSKFHNHEESTDRLLTLQDLFEFQDCMEKRFRGPLFGNPTYKYLLPPRRWTRKFGFEEDCLGPVKLSCEGDSDFPARRDISIPKVWLDYLSLYLIADDLIAGVEDYATADGDLSVGGVFQVGGKTRNTFLPYFVRWN